MILLALLYSLQYFITGTTQIPRIDVFLVIIIGGVIETMVEAKILSLKDKKDK